MNGPNLSELVKAAAGIAEAAGRAVLDVARGPLDVQDKEDGSPLTRADRASHDVIVAGLEALEPRLPILSEEGDLPSAGGFSGPFWLVDPLDGTKEFVKGLDEYTVNIALVEAGEPVLGVVYVPVTEVLYTAARGQGAFRSTAGGAAERILASRAARPVSAVVSRSHLSEETSALLKRWGVTETLPRGSSLKICAVAEGAADVYPRLGPTCLWDTAAGAAVAREAGCRVVDLQGEPLAYDPAAGIKHAGFYVYPGTMKLDV